jgi:hypothetical protein
LLLVYTQDLRTLAVSFIPHFFLLTRISTGFVLFRDRGLQLLRLDCLEEKLARRLHTLAIGHLGFFICSEDLRLLIHMIWPTLEELHYLYIPINLQVAPLLELLPLGLLLYF